MIYSVSNAGQSYSGQVIMADMLEDGNIVYLGRIDAQVKDRGYR
jgi:hypothetical protein